MVEDVRAFFAKGGPIAGAFGDGYEPRGQQVEMAVSVARAMAEKTHLLAEAGTGVGKSFAYLVPAMLRCLRGETVVVATNTIALQEQLILKDVPLLVGLMERAFAAQGKDNLPSPNPPPQGGGSGAGRIKPVLVKGRGNYVSIRRLKQASERQDKLFNDAAARRSLHVIEDWARETLDGTLSTLPAIEKMGVWDKVQSDSGNCMGRKCPTFDRCFYQSARAELEGANLLICNHALFFSDLALRAQDVGFLPRYQHVVLDEAHNVEDVASEHFGRSLAEGRVMHLLTTLCNARTGKGYLPNLVMYATDADAVERAIQLTVRAQEVCRGFFENVLRATRPAEQSAFGAGGRIRHPGAFENTLSEACAVLGQRLNTLKELVKTDADRFELNGYAERAKLIADDARVLVDQSQPGCAYWVESTGDEDWGGGGYQKVTLACAPVEVGPLLKERLFSAEHSVVLTSATIATKTVEAKAKEPIKAANKVEAQRFVPDDEMPREVAEATEPPKFVKQQDAFAHAMKRLGAEGARTMQVGSPFDYAKQVELIVDLTPPPAADEDSYGGERKRTWADDAAHVARRVIHHVKETDGGAFVLFTSLATLRAVAKLIREPLGALGHPVMAQTVDGSRTAMLEHFRKDERSVLLGAASFWQGVDVRGRGLRNVIIAKLPFDPPDRPLTQARHELIEARGGSSFGEDSLPRAIIRFKQGFGRLIRSSQDQGRVVVLDPRLVRSGYGKQFLAALPPGVRLRTLD